MRVDVRLRLYVQECIVAICLLNSGYYHLFGAFYGDFGILA